MVVPSNDRHVEPLGLQPNGSPREPTKTFATGVPCEALGIIDGYSVGFIDGTRLVVGLEVGNSVGLVDGAGVGAVLGSFGSNIPGISISPIRITLATLLV